MAGTYIYDSNIMRDLEVNEHIFVGRKINFLFVRPATFFSMKQLPAIEGIEKIDGLANEENLE